MDHVETKYWVTLEDGSIEHEDSRKASYPEPKPAVAFAKKLTENGTRARVEIEHIYASDAGVEWEVEGFELQ